MSDQIISKDKIDIRSVVRERYGAIAEKAGEGRQGDCGCGPAQSESSCCGPADDAESFSMVSKLYEDPNVTNLPAEVTDMSLGCGDPVTLASLEPGREDDI